MTSTDQFCELPGGIRICYRVDGPEGGRPLLLIAGLALDLTCWPPTLVSALADRGYRVIRFDNRDAGRSTHLTTPPPSTLRQALAITRPADYDLTDMANDTLGLLDALAIDRADFVGMSMGGMIAQVVAAIAPDRVRTLTSIFSTTGAPGVGRQARVHPARSVGPVHRRLSSGVQAELPVPQAHWRLDGAFEIAAFQPVLRGRRGGREAANRRSRSRPRLCGADPARWGVHRRDPRRCTPHSLACERRLQAGVVGLIHLQLIDCGDLQVRHKRSVVPIKRPLLDGQAKGGVERVEIPVAIEEGAQALGGAEFSLRRNLKLPPNDP